MNAGQITLNSPRGDYLYNLSKLDNIKTIVEIGTWHGGGSTTCILEALKHKTEFNFFTFEVNKEFYDIALKIKPDHPNIHFIYGSVIEEKDLLKTNTDDQTKIWLQEDIANIKKAPNIYNKIPAKIDLLVLDGGEFSSTAEFKLLKDRSSYIFLDDTYTLKNKDNREYLLNSKYYICLHDQQPTKDHHGWSVFLRK